MAAGRKRIRRRRKPVSGGNGSRAGAPTTFFDLLNLRQQRFVKYVLIYGDDPAKAADKAGYRCGMASATRLLKNPKVQAAIEEEKKKLIKRIELKQEKVLEELAKVAFFRIDQVMNFDGEQVQVKSFSDMYEWALVAIQELKMTRAGVHVKLYNKLDALQSLGRYFGIFNDKLDVNVGVKLSDVISALPPEVGERIRRALVERLSRTGNRAFSAGRKVISLSG